MGGGPLSHHSSVYTGVGYYNVYKYTNICNLYHIFVYAHMIYLVVICFKQIFLYHGGYHNLNV